MTHKIRRTAAAAAALQIVSSNGQVVTPPRPRPARARLAAAPAEWAKVPSDVRAAMWTILRRVAPTTQHERDAWLNLANKLQVLALEEAELVHEFEAFIDEQTAKKVGRRSR